MTVNDELTNKFFDINKLPPEEGIWIFPISMSRISNSQSAPKCWEYLKIFSPDKVTKPFIGLNFIYGDWLYLNSSESAASLKNKFASLVSSHRNEFLKIIAQNPFYIAKAFSFMTWNQAQLESKDFSQYLGRLRKLAEEDESFMNCLQEDATRAGKELDDNQLLFFLEEILLYHLIAKGQLRLPNDYVQDHEKWRLWCYPGPPLKSQIYVTKLNPFNLQNPQNTYENSYYDLRQQKLYDFSRVDLETIELETKE